MRPRLPTVVLQHEMDDGGHHDWLLVEPDTAHQPDGLLWTARVEPSSHDWAQRGTWLLKLVAPHRRHYLTYEGPISGGRGRVVRVDKGWFRPMLWTKRRIIIDLDLQNCQGCVEMCQIGAECWQAVLRPACSET